MNSLQLAFYKGVGGKWGALQFNLQHPHYYWKLNSKVKNFDGKYVSEAMKKQAAELGLSEPKAEELETREGALFLEATSASGPNKYDWDKKVTLALSIQDMGKILTVLEGTQPEVKIMHDPGAKSPTAGKVSKYLNLSSPQGVKVGVMVQISMKNGDVTTSHQIPLSGDECKTLAACIRAAIPLALAWK